MPDPDLEIRGRGGRSSRPLDKGGGGGLHHWRLLRLKLQHNGGDLRCFYTKRKPCSLKLKRYDFMRKLSLRKVTPVEK